MYFVSFFSHIGVLLLLSKNFRLATSYQVSSNDLVDRKSENSIQCLHLYERQVLILSRQPSNFDQKCPMENIIYKLEESKSLYFEEPDYKKRSIIAHNAFLIFGSISPSEIDPRRNADIVNKEIVALTLNAELLFWPNGSIVSNERFTDAIDKLINYGKQKNPEISPGARC